jgi:hypothetical protein
MHHLQDWYPMVRGVIRPCTGTVIRILSPSLRVDLQLALERISNALSSRYLSGEPGNYDQVLCLQVLTSL